MISLLLVAVGIVTTQDWQVQTDAGSSPDHGTKEA